MRRSLFLVLGLTTASILGWFINANRPDGIVSILLFSLLLFSSIVFLTLAITRNVFRSLLITVCVSTILVFRAFDVRNPLYSGLLIVFFLLVGIIYKRAISQKKPTSKPT